MANFCRYNLTYLVKFIYICGILVTCNHFVVKYGFKCLRAISSSKSYGSSSERYDRIRDSPNGNHRSDSPDSQSPRDRDRSYQSKSSYLQKMREKERENRDYKMSRDKYSDCARSPKDKRSRESEHRINNDRNDEKSILHHIKMSQNLSSRDRKPRDDRERVIRVGDWSEHVSSSGKKYYYNCKTEVSQWEKPREWIERLERSRDQFRSRDRDSDRCYNRSGTPANTSSSKDGARDSATDSRHRSSSSNRDDSDVPVKDVRSARKHPNENAQTTQDMDISLGDNTPTSEVSYGNSLTQRISEQSTLGPVLLANALSRLISHPIHMPSTPGRSEPSPQNTPSMMPVPTTVTISNAPGPPTSLGTLPRIMSQTTSTDNSDKNSHSSIGLQRQTVSGDSAVHTSLSVDTNHTGTVVEGPPTPTHSETSDCSK
ncbi:WW and/or Herpes BLLF1 domain containing protein, partial [Asbolus verrucosus]